MVETILRMISLPLVLTVCLGGCASKPPTIAHTHIGHAITGWVDTPGRKGLFTTAENAAQEALQAAEVAASSSDIKVIKEGVWGVVVATDPQIVNEEGDGAAVQYGLKSALVEASHHIKFAAESGDSTENIRKSSQGFSRSTAAVIGRCDTITLLGQTMMETTSLDASKSLAAELHKLARANIYGEDSDGDGVVGSSPYEYGLVQLREELQAMIDREKPPYRTVNEWYLFNLVRMPSGIWIFRFPGSGGGGGSYQ